MNLDVYFVILHYQTIDETTECVNSILNNIKYENKKIIIVDNDSPNKSGLYLMNYYRDNCNVEIIINNSNLGFAKGNNIGYRYAKENGAKYIIQVNSDTIFLDKNFVNELIEIYNQKKYSVLGPKIVSLGDGELQNPLKNGVKSLKDIEKKIIMLKCEAVLSYFRLDKLIIDLINGKKNNYDCNDYEYMEINKESDVLLHGCCFIFSPKYINMFDGMFEGTFMYYEEHILYYQCIKKGLKMLYTNRIELYHKRYASTKEIYSTDVSRRRFKYKESIKSLESFKNYILGRGEYGEL